MNLEKLTAKYRALIKERMPVITTAHTEKAHFYVMDGETYPSVTGALQIIKDPGLMNWKMNRALEWVETTLLKYPKFEWTPEAVTQLLETAKMVPVKEFEGAGSIGTAVHDWREELFSSWIDGGEYYKKLAIPEGSLPEVVSGCRGIKEFLAVTGYIPLACEMYLADPELKIGGTLDDIGILPHPIKIPTSDPVMGEGFKTVYKPKLCLVDLKTSNIGDKTSHFLQVALYYYMFRKLTGIKLQEFYILHVSKTYGTYKLIEIKNIDQLVKDAKILLKLNDSLARITEEKKKVPIVI